MFDGSMTTSLHTFYYPFHKLGFVNTHRTLYKPRLNPGLAITPSSVLSHKDESGKFLEYKKGSGPTTASTNNDSSNSLLGLANTVGIIGGVSLVSTLNFLRKLVQWSSKDGGSCPPFVLCSDPVLSKELLLVERSSIPSPSSKIESTKLDPTPIVENLRSKRIYLENSGARCIVMPCHIAHCWHDEISEGCSVPFLHMGECVAKELKEAKLKPLEAGSPLQIGVLATNETLTAGFYQEKLQSEGFEVVLPDKATMEHTVIPAIEALNRKDIEGAQNLLRIALQVILVRAVNSVILASDDMRNLLPRDDPLLKKCIDPMDALAWSTTKWAQSAEKDIWKKCRLVKPQKAELKKVRDLPPNERSAVSLLSDEQIGTSGVNFPSPKRNLSRAREMVLNRNDPECSAKIAKKVDKGKGRKPTRGVSSNSQSDPPENTSSSPSSVQPPVPTIQTSPPVQPVDQEKRKAPEVKTEKNKRTRQEPQVGSDGGDSMTVGAHLSSFVRGCVNVLTPSFIKKMWAPAEHPDFDEMAVQNSKQIMKLALQQFEVAREAVKAAKQLKSYKDKHEASDAALAEEKQMREEEHKRATELQVQLNTLGAVRALLAKNLEASDKRVAALEKLNRDLQNDVLEAEKRVLEEREVGVQAATKARHDGFWNLINKIQTKHPEWNLDFVAEGSDEKEDNIED